MKIQFYCDKVESRAGKVKKNKKRFFDSDFFFRKSLIWSILHIICLELTVCTRRGVKRVSSFTGGLFALFLLRRFLRAEQGPTFASLIAGPHVTSQGQLHCLAPTTRCDT